MADILDELEGMASVDPMVKRALDEIRTLRAQVADLSRLAGCAAVGQSFAELRNELPTVFRNAADPFPQNNHTSTLKVFHIDAKDGKRI
jgi:hypothetical protein